MKLLGGEEDILEKSINVDSSGAGKELMYKGHVLWEKSRRNLAHNENVSEARCHSAVRVEVIRSMVEFFSQRLPETEFQQLEPLRHIVPTTTDEQLRQCHQLIIPDLELSDFVMSYREVCDELQSAKPETLHPRVVIRRIHKVEVWRSLTVAIGRLLAAKPHSADVERLISSYNMLKTPDRSRLSPGTLFDLLYIRHNLPPLSQWDPRPSVMYWLSKRDRRPQQNPKKAKDQIWFKGIFF